MPAPERIWLTDDGEYDALRRQQLLGDDDLILWSEHRENANDTGYVRSDLHDRALDLLRRCAGEITADAQATVLCDCQPRRDVGHLVPLLKTAGLETRHQVEARIEILREIEQLAGRLTVASFLPNLLNGSAALGGPARQRDRPDPASVTADRSEPAAVAAQLAPRLDERS